MRKLRFLLAAIVLLAIAACKKDLPMPDEPTVAPTEQQKMGNNFFVENRRVPDFPVNGNGRSAQRETTGLSSGLPTSEFDDEVPMILGAQLNNPYTISNMTDAYNILYGGTLTTVPVTNLYVKFMPQTEAQFALLEDSMDLDVYDHPLDYELIQDGDYYVEPGRSIEDMPYIYTVVEPNFQFPSGIPYTILAQLHIPPNDDLLLEEFAESLAEGAVYYRVPNPTKKDARGIRIKDSVTIVRKDIESNPTLRLLPCYDQNPVEYNNDLEYIFNDCGGGWGPPPPPPPPTTVCGLPPLTCWNNKKPAGRMRVWDTQLNQCVPLVDVKVMAKRWFKSKYTYTNAQGQFTVDKNFNKKVKVNVFFRNTKVSMRPMRTNLGIRLSLFTIKHRVGLFENCAMNTIDQIYYRHENRNSKSFMYWLAAHGINARNDQWTQAVADGLKPFDGHRLIVYLLRGGEEFNRRPTAELLMQSYIFKKRHWTDWAYEAGKLALYIVKQNYVGAAVGLISNVVGGQRPDVMFRYNTLWENLSSSEVNQQFYSVYSEAGLLKAVDPDVTDLKWKRYFKMKGKQVDLAIGTFGTVLKANFKEVFGWKKIGGVVVAGDGNYISSIAATVSTMLLMVYYNETMPDREFYSQIWGFGEFYGHYLCDRRYGDKADALLNQQRDPIASSTGISSHKKYLEAWNASEPMDEEIHIKTGLFYDLDDTNNDIVPGSPGPGITDLVNGIKPKDYEKGISNGLVYPGGEQWWQTRENLRAKFPTQSTNILNLYTAYNVN